MPPPDKPVAAGAPDEQYTNTLRVGYIRLPLGHSARDDDACNTTTHFWFIIPTNSGGELTLTHKGQGGKLTFKGDPTKNVPPVQSDVGSIVVEIPKGAFGVFVVIAEGGSVREVESHFVQVGFARETKARNATPLIPWNFHFWPSARTFSSGHANSEISTINKMIRRSAHAYGKDEIAAVAWEQANHQISVGPEWVGHCHLGAAASILFQQPVVRTINAARPPHEPITFLAEELEFLAAEWFGGHGEKNVVFDLKTHGTGPRPGLYYTLLLKPSETSLGISDLTTRLAAALLAYEPRYGSHAKDLAEKATKRKDLGAIVARSFGEAAVDFYGRLIELVREDGHALEADLRATGGGNPPSEVWNHAIFYYSATYKEILPEARLGGAASPLNAYYMEIDVLLVANDDSGTPNSPGAPANAVPGGVDVNQTQWPSRKLRCKWNIVFQDADGGLKEFDYRNAWTSCRNGESGGAGEIYAPAYAAVIRPVGTTPETIEQNVDPNPLVIGNPFVPAELAFGTKPLLVVRPRYKR